MNPYPKGVSVVLDALAFDHNPDEVASVLYALSRPKKTRTKHQLAAFARGFARRFVQKPLTIAYKPHAPDQFNHTKRILQFGKPEIIRVLHELGHAKYGESEETAVLYSVGLLLKALPEFGPILDRHELKNDPY